MNEARTYARLVRRETYRSRSVAVIVALVVTVILVAYLGTEALLAALSRPALLLTPVQLLGSVREQAVWSVPAIIGLAALGIAAIAAAVTRGRRSRHRLDDDRMAVIVDDDVLAGALSRRVALSGSVDRRQTRTVVARRRATVRLTPHSGFLVDATAASRAAETTVEQLAPRPMIRSRVVVAENGVLS